ncbi:uncharacterized protein RHO25_003493 [Cercospora beticola]|uniref:Zn(2)-C6 fungal-type domain-containing protein n=1 Tax=Cercospora beticola TaxID=122368 RepID=A0ABZ0NH79_CERBT|nr:hypothetical protein RHO25_003493 [Cercospora beticola]
MESQDQAAPPPQPVFHADDATPSDGQPPQKRQRVSQACGPCRDRKTRCDGRQPICRACETRGVANTCNFDYVRRQRRPRTSGVQGAPGSSQHAQPPFRGADSDRNHAAAQALSDLGHPRDDTHQQSIPRPPVTPISGLHPSAGTASAPPGASHYPPGWRTARADGLATLADGNDGSMYGPSSTVAFLRHVMPNQSGTATPVDRSLTDPDVKPRPSAPIPDRQLPRTEGLAVLPKRRLADNFLNCYWEFIHPLFPVLHRPSFLRKYEALWTDDEHEGSRGTDSEVEEATFTSSLNLVFAIGCKFSALVDVTQKSSVAEDFFQRARQFYAYDILDSTSISVVQMLVLTGVYLQSTQHARRCWNSVGLAIRMAQSLGLHVDQSFRQSTSQVEQQMRLRIWHTCIHLDRLLSMTFGRPSMIDKQIDVPIPALIDDEFLAERGIGKQADNVPCRLGLFVSSSPLLELLEEILKRFYRQSGFHKTPSSCAETADLVEPVLSLNRKLDDFAENVPQYLRIFTNTTTPGNEDHVQLQQQVLYSRFLYVRLLSLRPILLAATSRGYRPSTKFSLDDDVIRTCCGRCVTTACQLVDVIHDNIHTLYRSSGWHSVYFTFSAAMTLLASWKVNDLHSRLDGDHRESAWLRCLVILEHYEHQIHSAEQAIKILKSLKAQILQPSHMQGKSMRGGTIIQSLPPTVNGTTPAAASMYPAVNLDDADLFSTDNISDAWYGQQLVNLDWLEIPQLYG